MLVSLSDLHLQDIESQQDTNIRSDQNVHHKAFIDFLQWISEEYLDKYKDETSEKLENLPSEVKFPDDLKDTILYDSSRKLLILKGVMSSGEKETLLGLSKDKRYNKAIEALFQKSQTEIKIVLNGDIIDFLRTERWFNFNDPIIRPYEDYDAQSIPPIRWEDPTQFPTLNSQVEDVLLEIFNVVTGIKYGVNYNDATPNVKTIKALAVLRRFKREVEGLGGAKLKKIHGLKIQYIFIPGNHDRLINVSSRLNAALRDFFLIENSQENYSAERFPWELHMPDYGVFLRHGHIYDWTNGEENIVFQRKDAKKTDYSFVWQKGIYKGYKDSKLYYNTPIGDLITIDLITFMPYRFIEDYYKPKKPSSLVKICKRLREIDDVRPQLAVLPWLYDVTEGNEELWKKIVDVVKKALDNTFSRDEGTAQGEFFRRWDSAHDRRFFPDKSDLFGNTIALAKKLLKTPKKLFEKIYSLMEKFNMGREESPVPKLIEEYIKGHKHPFMDSPQEYYVAGHIHSSSTHFLEEK
ncbi:MAG TPA: hypothetical protein ACFYEI_11075, partial [Candidatus Tripitaka californicus]|uniref:hypothetical protein n=1 Tax=Candidatus Tripitaka californicus TaxID=3367616 RepID=UPI004027ECB2